MKPVRVDFYLLQEDRPEAFNLLACRLLEKAYVRGNRIFVYCADAIKALELDALLWTFKPESFIPHQLQEDKDSSASPIYLGWDSPPQGNGFEDVLLNLSAEVPFFYPRFKRVIELVSPSTAAKQRSRAHYRSYRKDNCELHSHTIDTKESACI